MSITEAREKAEAALAEYKGTRSTLHVERANAKNLADSLQLLLAATAPVEGDEREALARLSAAARPGPWKAYETMQADNFIVKEGEGLLLGPGPIMGPSYDKATVEYVVALVNAHRAGRLDRPFIPTEEAVDRAARAIEAYDEEQPTGPFNIADDYRGKARAALSAVHPEVTP